MVARERLESELSAAREKIAQLNKQSEIEEKMSDELKEYLTKEKSLQFLTDTIPLNALRDSEVYHIAKFLIKENLLNIKLDDFFTDKEVEAARDAVIRYTKMYPNMLLNINNANEASTSRHKQYVTTMSYEEIAHLFEEGVIDYNFATQRKARIIKLRNKITRIASINTKNVSEIKDLILKNMFESNTITINIRRTGNEDFEYDEASHTLIIDRASSKLDVTDGYHRVKAINEAWHVNPDIKGNMIVCFKNLTVEEARLFIWQESKGAINNQEEMKLYDMNSNLAKLINDINAYNNSTNILFDKVSMTNNGENNLMYYEVFAENMKRSWFKILEGADIMQLIKIRNFICDFYAIAYMYINNKFKVGNMRDLVGLNNATTDQMFMAGMVHAAAKMYEDNNQTIDPIRIEKMVNKLDYSLENNKFTYESIVNRHKHEQYIKEWRRII